MKNVALKADRVTFKDTMTKWTVEQTQLPQETSRTKRNEKLQLVSYVWVRLMLNMNGK